MKRESELIRKILLHVEKQPVGKGVSLLEIDGFEKDVIGEHVRLLQENNYIEAQIACIRSNSGEKIVGNYSISRLLNEGHDFIANAKDETIWTQAMSEIKNKSGDVSLFVLKGLLTKLVLQQFGL